MVKNRGGAVNNWQTYIEPLHETPRLRKKN